MAPRSRPDTTVRHALWLGGMLIVLGGLFGMHGLDSHGAGAGVDAMHTTMSATAGAIGREMIDTAHVGAPAMVAARGGPGMDMGAAGMCVAILGLGLIALLLRIGASRSGPLMGLVARPVRTPRVRGRDPDPPSLIHLSIQRC